MIQMFVVLIFSTHSLVYGIEIVSMKVYILCVFPWCTALYLTRKVKVIIVENAGLCASVCRCDTPLNILLLEIGVVRQP